MDWLFREGKHTGVQRDREKTQIIHSVPTPERNDTFTTQKPRHETTAGLKRGHRGVPQWQGVLTVNLG